MKLITSYLRGGLALLSFLCLPAFGQFALVKDINPGHAAEYTSEYFPSSFFKWNSALYFSFGSPDLGFELWRTDGTESGTILLKDISPGFRSSQPSQFTVVGSFLYFTADDGVHGTEIWRTDGTATGTVLVSDINPGLAPSNPASLTAIGSSLYFSATNNRGKELWTTQTNTTSCQLVKDIFRGPASSSPSHLIEFNGLLYFNAMDTTNNQEIWVSDGTTGGTTILSDIRPGNKAESRPWYLTKFNNKIYFRTDGQPGGSELWLTDGTQEGTQFVSSFTGQILDFKASSTRLYFLEYFMNGDMNVWARSATHLFQIFETSSIDMGGGYVQKRQNPSFSVVDNKLFLSYHESTIDPQGYSFMYNSVSELKEDNGSNSQYYSTNIFSNMGSPTPPRLLVKTSTSEYYMLDYEYYGSSKLLKWSGSTYQSIKSLGATTPLTELNGALIFGASPNLIYRSNGTAAGTIILKKALPPPASSSPSNLRTLGNTILFSAIDANGFNGLWKSDGSSAGTELVTQAVEFNNSYGTSLAVGNHLFFTGTDAAHGEALWKTDGTSAGTILVKDIRTDAVFSLIQNFNSLHGKLLFTANAPTIGFSLWASDGTEAGTTLIADLDPTSASGSTSFTYATGDQGNILYFTTYTLTYGSELWRTDGTASGTYIIKDIDAGTAGSDPREMVGIDGILYFSAKTTPWGRELWRSDGTSTGTYQIKDLEAGPTYSSPQKITPYKNGFLFINYDDVWKSDGTESGTSIIKTFNQTYDSGSYKSIYINDLKVLGDFVYILDANEFWRTDGTTAGTIKLTNTVNEFPAQGSNSLLSLNGVLFFKGGDWPLNLWMSNGTIGGTKLINEVVNSGNFAIHENAFYFGAISESGAELWKYTLQNELSVTVSDVAIQNNELITDSQAVTTSEQSLFKLKLENKGSDNILLSPDSPITISGAAAAAFTGTPSAETIIIHSGEVLEYEIKFTSTIIGTHDVVINFSNNSITPIDSFRISLTTFKQDQTIDFETINNKLMGDEAFTLTAVATSDLLVNFSKTVSEKVTINDGVATIVSSGSVTIIASQPGNELFNAAPDVSQTFCINPPKPVITVESVATSLTLISSASTGNQWYLDNQAIAGANENSLLINEAGTYTVEVKIDDCVSELATAITVTSVTEEKELTIHPNPTSGIISINIPGEGNRQVMLTSITGTLVHRFVSDQETVNWDLSELAAGQYILRVSTAKGVYSRMLLKN